jgi:hypothetical protein
MVMRLQRSRSSEAMAGRQTSLISFGLILEKVQHVRSLKGEKDTAMRKAKIGIRRSRRKGKPALCLESIPPPSAVVCL